MSNEILKMNMLWDDIHALGGEVRGTELLSYSTPLLMSAYIDPLGRIVAVGDAGTLLLYDGQCWNRVGHVFSRQDFLCDVWARDPANVFFPVIRHDKDKLSTLQHFNSTSNEAPKVVLTAPRGVHMYRVAGEGNCIFVCGSEGFFGYYDGTKWADCRVPGNKQLWGVAAISEKQAYVVGQGGFVGKFDGTKVIPLDPVGEDVDLMAITVVGQDRFIVAGKSSKIWVYQSGTPHAVPPIDQEKRHLYSACTDGTNIMIVGEVASLSAKIAGGWKKMDLRGTTDKPYQLSKICPHPQGGFLAVGGKRRDTPEDVFYGVIVTFEIGTKP